MQLPEQLPRKLQVPRACLGIAACETDKNGQRHGLHPWQPM